MHTYAIYIPYVSVDRDDIRSWRLGRLVLVTLRESAHLLRFLFILQLYTRPGVALGPVWLSFRGENSWIVVVITLILIGTPDVSGIERA